MLGQGPSHTANAGVRGDARQVQMPAIGLRGVAASNIADARVTKGGGMLNIPTKIAGDQI